MSTQLGKISILELLMATARTVIKRLKRSFAQDHVYVMGHNILRDTPLPATAIDLEFKQITVRDHNEIDELIAIDEWQISKSDTRNMLEKGQLCYIAKYQGHVITYVWIVIGEKFEEYYFGRELIRAPQEAYHWRSATLPAFRGRGVMQYMNTQIDLELAHRFGKTYGLGLVRTNNQSMLRSVSMVGYAPVGRMGFYQIMNIRFHYLWGACAFKETKPRFKIQILW
jgi:GNAT superfamily N-acetyltransferase